MMWWHYWDVVRSRAWLEAVGHWGYPLEGNLVQSFSLLPDHHKVTSILCYGRMFYLTTGPQWWIWLWTEISDTMSQNKSFLLFDCFSQVFSGSDNTLTITVTLFLLGHRSKYMSRAMSTIFNPCAKSVTCLFKKISPGRLFKNSSGGLFQSWPHKRLFHVEAQKLLRWAVGDCCQFPDVCPHSQEIQNLKPKAKGLFWDNSYSEL
jgi:hypothetical protein